ncbi:uncharacterized protein LOC115550493 [Gadus morhua]|uniref:uncharacterized protein LOC115550493 n=1 Tax=Gadus morhua TaxID=8049 RepID=UPI0011B76DE4|nr:uncharacterized protein LOC115550493 [Gadus morhua]
MVVQCAFRNCTNKPNRWSTQSFHQFPTRDPERTKLWLVAGGLDIKTPAETARNWKICSDHFRPDDFEKPSNLKSKASLKSNAVPSVFSDAPTATGEQVTHSAASGQPKEIQMPSALEKTVAEDDNPLDLSMSSIEASPSRPVDSSFVPLFSTSSSSSSDIPDILSAAGTKNWSEKKWIVNESKLMQLFTTCQQCGVLIEEEDKKVTTSGTRIHIKWSCMKGHSGSTFTEIFDWAELLNLQIPKKTTFYSLQSTYLIPVIEYAYRDHHEEMMSNLQLQTVGGGISICGDGRSDSPGFSAKYTTYSFMSNATQEIIMVDLVQELKRRWMSVLHHICGIHRWEEDGQERTCYHRDLTEEQQRRKKWLQTDSAAFQTLSDHVLNKNLLKDLNHMTLFQHTGALEVYHSAMLKYTEKRLHFAYSSMKARTLLSVMDNNENVGRQQATTSDGTPRYNLVFPKQSKRWVARKRYEPTRQTFRKDLVERVLERRMDPTVKFADPHFYIQQPATIPDNIATTPRPDKDQSIAEHVSRFKT